MTCVLVLGHSVFTSCLVEHHIFSMLHGKKSWWIIDCQPRRDFYYQSWNVLNAFKCLTNYFSDVTHLPLDNS